MKPVVIGIIGIPIKFDKKEDNFLEFFSPGLTDSLRLRTKKFLEKMNEKRDNKIRVIDLGELIIDQKFSESKEPRIKGISKDCLDELAQELRSKIKGLDLLIVYGGTHTGAYLLYHLPGKIERFDLHEDDQKIGVLFHTSYMNYSKELKSPSQILDHGWSDLLDGILDEKKEEFKTDIFDIDVDYYTSTEFCRLKKEDERDHLKKIERRIEEVKPRIIGLFEFQTLDGTEEGLKKVLRIVWSGVKAIEES